MSYRTYINGIQVFGNNEYYDEWFEFIRKQGIHIGEEYRYEGTLTDFMGAIEACESVVMRLEAERIALRAKAGPLENRYSSLFDLGYIKEKILHPDPARAYNARLFDELYDLSDSGYLFLPMAVYRACKDDLALDPSHPSRFRAYKLKPGRLIRVSAG